MDADAKQMLGHASRYSYLGIFFGVAICIGYFGGRWIDEKLVTPPWFSLVGLVVGVAAGFRELVRVARRSQREQEEYEAEQQDTPKKP